MDTKTTELVTKAKAAKTHTLLFTLTRSGIGDTGNNSELDCIKAADIRAILPLMELLEALGDRTEP